MTKTLNYVYRGQYAGQPFRMVCGCIVATPRGLGRAPPRIHGVAELTKKRCRECAEAHMRAQASNLTDPDGNPLLEADWKEFLNK